MYSRRRDGHSYDSMEARALESEARNVTGNSRMTARVCAIHRKKKKKSVLTYIRRRDLRDRYTSFEIVIVLVNSIIPILTRL